MNSIIDHITDTISGKHPLTTARSGGWPTVRKHFLETHPTCAVCGSKDKLEVHHIRPFHLHPELELDPTNFITLCESKSMGGLNCHIIFGHLSNFKSFNVDVVEDAKIWNDKIKNRPLGEKIEVGVNNES